MDQDTIEVELIVDREISYKENTSWGSFACTPVEKDADKVKYNKYQSLGISGIIPRLEPGTMWKAKLTLQPFHPVFYYSYKVDKIWQDRPKTPADQRKFFNQILTERQVENIFNAYPNEDIVQLFIDDKLDYNKIFGFGEYTYKTTRTKVVDNIELMEALVELSEYGLTFGDIKKIAKKYTSVSLAVEKIKTNPYELTVIPSFGFAKVDAIALSNGIEKDSAFRIHSAVKHTLKENQNDGHSYLAMETLYKRVKELLNIDGQTIHKELVSEIEDVIVVDGNKYCLQHTYETEKYIAKRLSEIQSNSYELNIDMDKFILEHEEKSGFKLTDEQKDFFNKLKYNNINILVGWAGCGKTAIQTITLKLMEKLGLRIRVLAPSAQAAKVSSQYTGFEAETIHKAIGLFTDDEEGVNYINEDIILIEESSMLDIFVCKRLLERISNKNARIVFSGDPGQLPSVSAGSLLRDLFYSEAFASTQLTQVFRQKEGGILDIATKVRQKECIIDNKFAGKQVFGKDAIFHSVDQKWIEKGYKHYYQSSLKKFKPEQIMVLSPTKKGNIGVININSEIQKIVNPENENKKEYKYKDTIFRVDDNVMNIQNTYNVLDQNGDKINIVNGDSGVVKDIDEKKNCLIIDYDFAVVETPFSQLSNLMLAYCLTIHKSQGDSAEVVIMIVDKSHKYQLNSNLLYTAATRSKKYLYIVGQAESFNYGTKIDGTKMRNNFLKDLLLNNKKDEKDNGKAS